MRSGQAASLPALSSPEIGFLPAMKGLKPFKTPANYAAAVAEMRRLWASSLPRPTATASTSFGTLVDTYEAHHFPMHPPDPIEAIKFRMEQQGLTRKGLEDILGTRTRAAEVLTRRRGLPINMIRRLNEKLGISAEVLIRPGRAGRPRSGQTPNLAARC